MVPFLPVHLRPWTRLKPAVVCFIPGSRQPCSQGFPSTSPLRAVQGVGGREILGTRLEPRNSIQNFGDGDTGESETRARAKFGGSAARDVIFTRSRSFISSVSPKLEIETACSLHLERKHTTIYNRNNNSAAATFWEPMKLQQCRSLRELKTHTSYPNYPRNPREER